MHNTKGLLMPTNKFRGQKGFEAFTEDSGYLASRWCLGFVTCPPMKEWDTCWTWTGSTMLEWRPWQEGAVPVWWVRQSSYPSTWSVSTWWCSASTLGPARETSPPTRWPWTRREGRGCRSLGTSPGLFMSGTAWGDFTGEIWLDCQQTASPITS